jgi:hypothetical protein
MAWMWRERRFSAVLDGAWGFGGGEGEVFEVFLDGLEGLGWEEFAVFVEEFEGVQPAGLWRR